MVTGGEINKMDASADAAEILNPVESIEADPKEEPAADEGEPDGGIEADEMELDGRPVSNEQYKALKSIADNLTNYKIKKRLRGGEQEYFPSSLFRRLPNKNRLPDYYQVIQEPSALSTLKGKIQRKLYTGIPEYVRDFALIVHNAQIYNRPNSAPVRDVLRLEAVFKEEMIKLVEQGLVKEEEIEFPDLGPIPDATPEPDPVDEDEEDLDDDDEDEDEEEDAGDDSDDDRRRKRGRRGRASQGGRKQDRDEDDDGDKKEDAEQKRRGRPPKVDTPMEARIKIILKGIRKAKNESGQFMNPDFERLPDKAEHPSYFVAIKNPIALDVIRKKSKRKKYSSVDDFMQDVRLMFDNAMAYNEDGSLIYENAKALMKEAQSLADAEKAKPDSEYLMQDGRLPLPFINYNGKLWRVGDWIHIRNPNDVTKPIVAQIYRTWQDENEQKWINACWYYRPEQTVHQYEKHFYPHEVVKTGQYRDHPIEEVVDKCFVMFFTRYSRGRPRGIDPSQEVYVCEARYNEEKFKFNKIKTWASCLPDEVRDKDYEMDLYDVPKRVKKIPSPIINLLKDDAKSDEPLPQPQWGNPNAPPIVGAVHKRPRDDNQSPPPEPTPPPPSPPPVARPPPPPALSTQQSQQPAMERQSSNHVDTTEATRPSPSVPPTPSNANASSNFQFAQGSFPQQSASVHYQPPQTPTQPQPTSYTPAHPVQAGNMSAAHTVNNYSVPPPIQNYGRPPSMAYPGPHQYSAYATTGNDMRQKEVYVLSEAANAAIPKEIRDCFPQDDQGRVLFFTQPPVNTSHVTTGRTKPEREKPLQHTQRYLDKHTDLIRWGVKRKQGEGATKSTSRLPDSRMRDSRLGPGGPLADDKYEEQQQAIQVGLKKLRRNHGQTPSRAGGQLRISLADGKSNRLAQYQRLQEAQQELGLYKDFWTGVYQDDIDPRLPS